MIFGSKDRKSFGTFIKFSLLTFLLIVITAAFAGPSKLAASDTAVSPGAKAQFAEGEVLVVMKSPALVSAAPDDTRYAQQWGLKKINAPTAWDSTTGSSDIITAVIDTGVVYDHPDLKDNIYKFSDGSYGMMFHNNGSSTKITGPATDGAKITSWDRVGDISGHGTHVAGIIGAVGNNGQGVAGVNWKVKILTVGVFSPVLDNEGNIFNVAAYDADVIKGLNYIVDQKKNNGLNIRVANMSLGHMTDILSDGSAFGLAVKYPEFRQTYNASGYISIGGTSMASPMAAGAAALLCAAFPTKTAGEIKALLTNSASGVCKAGFSKYGQIDIAAAMTYKTLVASITLDRTSLSLTPGKTAQLLAALSLAAVWLRPSSAENGVIEISTLEQLETFRDNVNKGVSADAKVMLTADIDLGGQSAPWTPIGYYSMNYNESNDTFETEDNTFKGVFDGQGHKISGLYVSSDKDCQGLFSYISGKESEIKNLAVSGAVSGSNYVGAVAGQNNGGTVTNCTAECRVNGVGSVGGAVGQNNSGTVENCAASGDIREEDECVGGIAGQNDGGTVGECDTRGLVTNCTASGSISGSDKVGGIAGENLGLTIANCASACSLKSAGNNVGGVIGRNGTYNYGNTVYPVVNNCGWLWSGDNGAGLTGYTARVDSVVSFDEKDLSNIAVTFNVEPKSLTVAKGGTGNFAIPKAPHTAGVGLSLDESVAEATASSADGAIAVTGIGYGTTEMTVSADFHPTLFSGDLTGVLDASQIAANVIITVSGDAPASPDKSPGGSSGGCNAGTGALALLMAVPFGVILKRR